MDVNIDDSSSVENSTTIRQVKDGERVAPEKPKPDPQDKSEKAVGDSHKLAKSSKEVSVKDEHSSKKPNVDYMNTGENRKSIGNEKSEKKSSSAEKDSGSAFKRGSLVWVHIKGFPWWPGLVVKESDVPDDKKKVQMSLILSFFQLLNTL